ncbi:MAG: efflux RND transporter periplasmic adaptor subunit [Desulfotignum sp.]|jgi:RND family efflux transporter MFP subunit|nr:efflux RND transporter periplasmic adaptor subunit [Desulfotignum sp.]
MSITGYRSLPIFYCSLVAVLILTGCSESRDADTASDPGGKEPVTVKVAEITPWQKALTRHFPGVVSPGRRAVLSTRTNGTIKSIRVQAGDHVTSGAVLAHVESRDVEAAIAGTTAQLKAAEIADAKALRDVNRLKRLYGEDLIARNRLELAQVKQQKSAANVEKIRAELKVQQVNRSYANITAPFTGIISEVVMDEGSFIGPGRPVLILEDRTTLQIDVPIPSETADQITPQDMLSVLDPSMRQPLQARFLAILSPMENASAGQVLRLSLENPPETIQPGQVVTVLLNETGQKGLVALPRAALIRRGQLTGVLVVEQMQNKNFVCLRWIRLAVQKSGENNFIPVSQGLDPGELVVLNPSSDLRDGQQIRADRESF